MVVYEIWSFWAAVLPLAALVSQQLPSLGAAEGESSRWGRGVCEHLLDHSFQREDTMLISFQRREPFSDMQPCRSVGLQEL